MGLKVVLFCGGLGTRLRDYSDAVPKPMVPVGSRPIIWHVMKYYAHYGHTDFILALGYKADVIKNFFLNYDEAGSNDFVMSFGGRQIDYITTDIDDWTITFADTGIHSSIGDRLLAVRKYLGDDEIFLSNYSDGVTNLPLDSYIEDFRRSDSIAKMLLVQPPLTYHRVENDENGLVTHVEPIAGSDLWINGGYFAMRSEFFDYMEAGDDIPGKVFDRLIEKRLLSSERYTGFWAPMDTFKDKQRLDDLYTRGQAPWEIWKNGA